MTKNIEKYKNLVNVLINVGESLSAEKDQNSLLEKIVTYAKQVTNADAATLYLMSDDKKKLIFEIAQTDSMGFRAGGTSGVPINWYPVKLYLENDEPYYEMVSAYVALTGETKNFADVYEVEGFNFQGTKAFDKKNNYRTKSMLTIAMKNHEDEIIGVLQLINAQKKNKGNQVIPFDTEAQRISEALASQAAIAITKNRLLFELEALLDSFIKVIAAAIDEKSPYTGGHIERVAKLTLDIAQHLTQKQDGEYAAVSFNEDEMKEIRIAAWLHDIGKITTPEYVVDKATKLETIFDRIQNVKLRVEILKRDAEIDYWRNLATLDKNAEDYTAKETKLRGILQQELSRLQEEMDFLEKVNMGGEFMAPPLKERVFQISQQNFMLDGKAQPFLSNEEVQNLNISRGTLNDREREIINNHVVMTIKMLNQLPFPKKLSRVAEFAGGHHERLDGTGYPNGVGETELSLPARIMALADIFEALTAADRPYKKGKTLSEAVKILGFMAKDRHIDPTLLKTFLEDGLHIEYAKKYINPAQIDIPDSE